MSLSLDTSSESAVVIWFSNHKPPVQLELLPRLRPSLVSCYHRKTLRGASGCAFMQVVFQITVYTAEGSSLRDWLLITRLEE